MEFMIAVILGVLFVLQPCLVLLVTFLVILSIFAIAWISHKLNPPKKYVPLTYEQRSTLKQKEQEEYYPWGEVRNKYE